MSVNLHSSSFQEPLFPKKPHFTVDNARQFYSPGGKLSSGMRKERSTIELFVPFRAIMNTSNAISSGQAFEGDTTFTSIIRASYADWRIYFEMWNDHRPGILYLLVYPLVLYLHF